MTKKKNKLKFAQTLNQGYVPYPYKEFVSDIIKYYKDISLLDLMNNSDNKEVDESED